MPRIRNIHIIEEFMQNNEGARKILMETAKKDKQLVSKLIEEISEGRIKTLKELEKRIEKRKNRKKAMKVLYNTALIFSLLFFKPKILYTPKLDKDKIIDYLVNYYRSEKIEFEDYFRYYRITSNFGEKRHGYGRKTRMHEGIDMAANKKEDRYIRAFMDGIVVYRAYGWNGGWGNLVVTRHRLHKRVLEDITKKILNNDVADSVYLYLLYAHCGKIYKKIGERIKKSDKLAYMWKSGRAKGIHVHIEARISDKKLSSIEDIIKLKPINFKEVEKDIKKYNLGIEYLTENSLEKF